MSGLFVFKSGRPLHAVWAPIYKIIAAMPQPTAPRCINPLLVEYVSNGILHMAQQNILHNVKLGPPTDQVMSLVTLNRAGFCISLGQ